MPPPPTTNHQPAAKLYEKEIKEAHLPVCEECAVESMEHVDDGFSDSVAVQFFLQSSVVVIANDAVTDEPGLHLTEKHDQARIESCCRPMCKGPLSGIPTLSFKWAGHPSPSLQRARSCRRLSHSDCLSFVHNIVNIDSQRRSVCVHRLACHRHVSPHEILLPL